MTGQLSLARFENLALQQPRKSSATLARDLQEFASRNGPRVRRFKDQTTGRSFSKETGQNVSRITEFVRWLVFWAQSTTKNYIRAENKRQYIFWVFIPHAIIPLVSLFFFSFLFSQTTTQIISTISESKKQQTITCFGVYLRSVGTQHGNLRQLWFNEQGDLYYSASPQRNWW